MIKSYCTQNSGDCPTCSLTNYNRDCQNNPIQGGHRPGAGRKPTGRKRQQFYITDAEYAALKKYLENLRNEQIGR
jgi:hypothetical protein